MLIDYNEMKSVFKEILITKGTPVDLADMAAEIFTDNSCDGVVSHGVNRFPTVIEFIDRGFIDVTQRPHLLNASGSIEVYDGNLGLGMCNAKYAMDRAMKIADQQGIGCVALKNTNHWMRGATYGIQAAQKGYGAICFTNTKPNMPPWGAKDCRVGNNPMVIAVPGNEGPIVLDMAMSQFSYGKLEVTALENDQLPFSGGFNQKGELTSNPQSILESGRILPAGYWKGSGLSIILDLLAVLLSGGNSTMEIGKRDEEYGVTQIFIAFNPEIFNSGEDILDKIKESIDYIHNGTPVDEFSSIRYPGEGSSARREKNLSNGIPVNDSIWSKVLLLKR